MNSPAPNALLPARIWGFRLYTFTALAGFALFSGQILSAAPPRSAAKKSPSPTPAAKTPAPPADSSPVVSWDDLEATPGKDLQLTPDNLKKADALADFVQGSLHEDDADLDGALASYRKVLTTDPAAKIRGQDGDEKLTLLSGKVAFELAQSGDPAAGIDLLKDTIKASPKEATAYFFLSQLYEKSLGKNDVALKYAEQALDIDQDNFSFYMANYELQLNLGQPKKAADILDRASKVDTSDPDYWLDLSDLYVRDTLKDNRPIAPEDLKKLNTLFQKAVSLAGDNPAVLAKVADFDRLTKQPAEAIPLYQKALGLKADSTDPVFLEARSRLAQSFIDTGRNDEAIQTLEDLVKLDSLSASSYKQLGLLYNEKKDYAHALDSLQQYLLLNSGDPRNYLAVMDLMLRLKKYDQAVDLMNDAHHKFPDIPPITYRLAVALTAAKKNDEALATFEQAESEARIADKEMLDGQFYYDYGAAAGQAGQIDRATTLLNQSITIDPKGETLAPYPGSAYNDLGYLWVDHDQRVDEGGQLIQRALEMEPGNPTYIDSLGWFYFKKGDLDKALEQLLKAAEATKPEDPTVDDHVAQTYQKMGKIPEALNYWQKAIALDPANKDIAKKIEAAKQNDGHLSSAPPK